jgi:hypothetical protein
MYSWGTLLRDGGGNGLGVKDEDEGDCRVMGDDCMGVGENGGAF